MQICPNRASSEVPAAEQHPLFSLLLAFGPGMIGQLLAKLNHMACLKCVSIFFLKDTGRKLLHLDNAKEFHSRALKGLCG